VVGLIVQQAEPSLVAALIALFTFQDLSKPLLDLSGCSIRCLNPVFVAALGGVRILNLSNNLLETLPAELAFTGSLEIVHFDRNPLTYIPLPYRVSWLKLKSYLKYINLRASSWLERKMIVVGEENSGKSVRIAQCHSIRYSILFFYCTDCKRPRSQ